MSFLQIKETTLNERLGRLSARRLGRFHRNVMTKAGQNVLRANTEMENFCSYCLVLGL